MGTEAANDRRARAITLALLASVFAVHFLDRQLLAILIPPIKAELALSDTALGFLSGFAFTAFFSTVGLVIARLADRSDRARIITWSIVAFSAMTALCGLATSFWQLLAARIGVGAGEGGTSPASHSLIADLYPMHSRATAMGIFSIGPNVGVILAFGIGGWLAQAHGWRTAFFAAGLLGLAVAVATRVALRDPRNGPGGRHREAGPRALDVVGAIVRSPTLRHVFVGSTLMTAAGIGAVTWLPTLLTRVHGFTLAQAGVFLAVVLGVGGACGTYACGWLADRVSATDPRRKLQFLATLSLVLALTMPLPFLVTAPWAVLVLLVVPCVLFGGYLGPTLAVVQGVADPRARAFVAAMLMFVGNLVGAGVGPFAVGLASDLLAASTGLHALRYGLLIMPVLVLWSGYHYWRAAPTLIAELRG